MKKISENNKKKALLSMVILLLFLPFFQHGTRWFNERELKGSFVKSPRVSFTFENWWNGDFQEGTDKYVHDHFGFRGSFVRLYNQSQFSFYGIAKANGVVIGREDYLYELNYIRAYYGTDFIGEDTIQQRVHELKKVRDTLNALGKELLVILAPGKGSYYPEFIPREHQIKRAKITNHRVYARELTLTGIPTIDCKRWFLEMKSTTPYPLFGRGGIHWSKYGEFLAADTILQTIEELTGNDLPDVVLDSIIYQAENQWEDYDIGDAMNLLFMTKTDSMAYPIFHFEHIEKKNETRVLTVADSYYWGLFNYGFSQNVFNNGEFWYYNEQIFPDQGMPIFINELTDEEILERVQNNDLVMIIATDANLHRFPFGFIDPLYDHYYKSQNAHDE